MKPKTFHLLMRYFPLSALKGNGFHRSDPSFDSWVPGQLRLGSGQNAQHAVVLKMWLGKVRQSIARVLKGCPSGEGLTSKREKNKKSPQTARGFAHSLQTSQVGGGSPPARGSEGGGGECLPRAGAAECLGAPESLAHAAGLAVSGGRVLETAAKMGKTVGNKGGFPWKKPTCVAKVRFNELETWGVDGPWKKPTCQTCGEMRFNEVDTWAGEMGFGTRKMKNSHVPLKR